MRTLTWVDTPTALKQAISESKGAERIALDAEMDSYFVYKTKLCLVQMSVEDRDYLIDPLSLSDLTPLNELTENPDIIKVFHAGENDVPYFRSREVRFKNIFDTHIAAKFLELSSKSLGGLVELYFDVVLAKDQSRADWRIRPLPEEQVEYARQDTQYLCPLAERLWDELKEADASKEARQTFAGLEELDLRVKEFDPDGWARIKGSKELSPSHRTVLKELFACRERLAEEEDLALFRIAHNGALLSLARKRFQTVDQLKGWAKSPTLKKNAGVLLEAMERGREAGPIPFPSPRGRHGNDWSKEDEKVFEVLRKWRNEESEKKGVEPSRIFSNRQLKNVARERPKDSKSLAKVDGLEPWKLEEYGAEVIRLVSSAK
ncbi:MAG: HRDC domain-containing protein [Candidatus Eremiobacteraeota bacterium]|nr:HRDC domain-containing protein [Candidatus Eremiobacteraeota bacterium]